MENRKLKIVSFGTFASILPAHDLSGHNRGHYFYILTEEHQVEPLRKMVEFSPASQVAEYEKNDRRPLQFPLQ